MRKAIVYASVHHGNTEKLVKGIVEECQVDLIDAVKQPDADLSRKFAPHTLRVYCVYRVKTCGPIVRDTQRKVESVYAVKGKRNRRCCGD